MERTLTMAVQITYFITMICSAVVLGQINVGFHNLGLLDGKRCTTPLFSDVVRSKIACAAKCAAYASCKSQFYKPGTNTCFGCDSVYQFSDLSLLVDEPGTLYFMPYALYNQNCSTSDKPCIENNNKCFAGLDTCVCDPLYNYDPSTKSCISECTTYGSTYQMYPHYAVSGNDGLVQGLQDDPDLCLSYCSYNTTTFTCHGVDWDFINKICYYNNVKVGTANAHLWIPWNIFQSFVRNCA